MGSCTYDTIDKCAITDCPIDESVKSKETAKTLILGKWNWIKTTYPRKGIEITTENPLSADKTLTFEFTDKKARIFENNILAEE